MSTPELEREAETSGSENPRSLRPLLLRLHFYAGILIAPFILIAAVSGGLYAIAPTLEQVVYRDYLHVESTGTAVPVGEQITSALRERPDLAVSAVRPAATPGETTRVLFTDPSLGESERLAVFVDPATAEPVGELTVYGSVGALPLRGWISQLHRNLHLGEPGRLYSELAASWLWVIALGGLYLWVDRYRKAKRRDAEKARLLTVDRSGSQRSRTLNWHGAVGIWLAAGLVFLSATGLTWSRYAGDNVDQLRTAMSWTTPTVSSSLGSEPSAPSGGHDGHGGHAPKADPALLGANIDRIDSVLAVAATNGVTGAVEASIPVDGDTAFVVKQTRQAWVFSTNAVAVDGATAEVTDVLRFSDWPLAAKLTSWGIALHMGVLFGLVSQLALVALAIALVTVIARGYLMWWRRRPARGSNFAVGRAPTRGGIRRVSTPVAVAILAGFIAIGYFVPLVGLSLLGFLVIDAAVGFLKSSPIMFERNGINDK